MAVKKRKPPAKIAAKAKKVTKKTVAKATARVAKKGTGLKAAGRVKSSAKKIAVVKTAAVKVVRTAPVTSVSKPYTKSQVFTTLASSVGIHRKEVSMLFDHLNLLIGAHLKKQGPGHFTLPSLMKITIKNKPATKARKGVNPFTGEEMMFKAKPARNVVKIRPLQKLKDMV